MKYHTSNLREPETIEAQKAGKEYSVSKYHRMTKFGRDRSTLQGNRGSDRGMESKKLDFQHHYPSAHETTEQFISYILHQPLPQAVPQ